MQILELHDPRGTLPRSNTTVLGLDDEKGQQELGPRGPSAMLPLNTIFKDAFEKFEQDFLASNLPEGKNIPNLRLQQPNTTKWDNLVLRTNFRSLIQILPRSVFLLSPLGPLLARFPTSLRSLRSLNTKLGKISLPSILQLLSQRLLLLVTLLWRSVSRISRLPLRGLKARFRRVLILKELPGVAMKMPVTILRL